MTVAKARKKILDMPKYLARLADAIKASRSSLEPFRRNRRNMVRQMVGSNWSDDGAPERVPVNLIYQYVSIMARHLIAKNPRVMLTTFQKQAKPVVAAMKKWMNDEIDRMYLAETLRRIVVDAFFGPGVGMVALSTPSDAHAHGWNLPAGKPFVSQIDLDDFAFDVHAHDFREVDFMAHRYRPSLESIRDSNLYTKARKNLVASDDPFHNEEGDERISMLGRGYTGPQDELEEKVELWQVYIPSKKLILTLEADEGGTPSTNEPLREQEWVGPDCGPYHILGFGTVPGNAMPLAPLPIVFDLHLFVNQTFRKLMRQAQRQKEVIPVRGGATEDMTRLEGTDDGFPFRCDNADNLKPVVYGGPNQQNFAMFMAAKQLFDQAAGNLSLLGGASPQSKTATQDKILNENAGAGVADKQGDVAKWVQGVCEALGWYFVHDPFLTMKTEEPIPGLSDMAISRRVTPEQRQQVNWEDLQIRVSPYSLQPQTPLAMLMALKETVKDLMPLMPLLQQQGIMFDLGVYLEKVGEYLDDPDIGEVFAVQEAMPQPEGQGAPSAGGMPGETTRNYVRESRSDKTQQGQMENMIPQLMTGNDQGGSRNGQANGVM